MKRALLVIDVQYEYFTGELPVTYPENSFVPILKAVDAANNNKIPVILVKHTSLDKDDTSFVEGSKQWQIHQELLSREHTQIVDKHLPGSFTDTGLEDLLRKLEIDTVVICGYMTQMCCDTTARQAFHLGFSVEFLSDATGTLDFSSPAGNATAEQIHRVTLVTQATMFSKVMSSDEWIRQIDKSFNT